MITGGSPRAIGRAGAGTVGDDGGGALLVNPAALARRDTKRAQVGISVIDDNVVWQRYVDGAPTAHDQAGSVALPFLALEGAIGAWVIGAAAMTSTASQRVFRRPGRIPPESFASAFDYRYAGLEGSQRRDTVTLGVARRFGDAVAIGVAIAGSRVGIVETRRLWAGFAGRKEVIGDPAHDVEIGMTADDTFSPSAVAGVLIAPPDTRVELAASIAWARTAHVQGDVAAIGTMPAVSVQATGASAELDVREPLTLRAGARWLGERWIAEVDGDLWLFPSAAETASWQLHGLRVVDSSGVGVDLHSLPSRLSSRTHGAMRGSLDVELIAGFLWATAGYALTTSGTSTARLSPTFGDLGGHTFAAGLEANGGGVTITLGWARTWSIRRSAPTSSWQLDNPFRAGDAEVPAGNYDGSSDMVGIMIDLELEAPK
ncbi:MAG: hypothetical protein JWO36_6602 [Myxococcales bacterium]|nr:hypothetical protein [Myxococcales bacterium]